MAVIGLSEVDRVAPTIDAKFMAGSWGETVRLVELVLERGSKVAVVKVMGVYFVSEINYVGSGVIDE